MYIRKVDAPAKVLKIIPDIHTPDEKNPFQIKDLSIRFIKDAVRIYDPDRLRIKTVGRKSGA
jgi:hypothetical protein